MTRISHDRRALLSQRPLIEYTTKILTPNNYPIPHIMNKKNWQNPVGIESTAFPEFRLHGTFLPPFPHCHSSLHQHQLALFSPTVSGEGCLSSRAASLLSEEAGELGMLGPITIVAECPRVWHFLVCLFLTSTMGMLVELEVPLWVEGFVKSGGGYTRGALPSIVASAEPGS